MDVENETVSEWRKRIGNPNAMPNTDEMWADWMIRTGNKIRFALVVFVGCVFGLVIRALFINYLGK